jgi:hypothetical protein
MRLTPLPAFQEDYLWFLHDGWTAPAADPGDAQPVMASLQRAGLELGAILVTHHPCGHTPEYTLSNLKLAPAPEPGNLKLIHFENPSLRTGEPAVVQAARGHDAATAPDEASAFATLRAWKNGFR